MVEKETTQHLDVRCPNINPLRNELLNTVNPILVANIVYHLSDTELSHILLYGHEHFSRYQNQIILSATIDFVKKIARFPRT